MAHPAYPAAPLWGPGSAVSSLSGVRGRSRTLLYCMLTKRIWLQHFHSFVSIAMSGKMKANPGSGLINIIFIQTGKLIFVGSKIAAPLNFAALFGRTPRTRPALQTGQVSIVLPALLIFFHFTRWNKMFIRIRQNRNTNTNTK